MDICLFAGDWLRERVCSKVNSFTGGSKYYIFSAGSVCFREDLSTENDGRYVMAEMLQILHR